MGAKGLDFKHKEVVNITDGRRLRLCAGCNCGFGVRDYHFYDGCKKENRYSRFEFIRKVRRSGYVTRSGEKRTGYVMREKFVYEVVGKVEM